MHYVIQRAAPGAWRMSRQEGDKLYLIAQYSSKRAAVNAARLLAGWRGVVTLAR